MGREVGEGGDLLGVDVGWDGICLSLSLEELQVASVEQAGSGVDWTERTASRSKEGRWGGEVKQGEASP